MSQLQLLPPPPVVSQKWRWPLDPSRYDHSVELSPVELCLLKGWLGPAPDLQKLKLKKGLEPG